MDATQLTRAVNTTSCRVSSGPSCPAGWRRTRSTGSAGSACSRPTSSTPSSCPTLTAAHPLGQPARGDRHRRGGWRRHPPAPPRRIARTRAMRHLGAPRRPASSPKQVAPGSAPNSPRPASTSTSRRTSTSTPIRDNPVIGVRSFGADPDAGRRATPRPGSRGLQSAGVAAACAKHFPGHGDTATTRISALPTSTWTAERCGSASWCRSSRRSRPARWRS